MSIPPKELVKGSKWPINGDSLETKRSLSHKFNNEASIGEKKNDCGHEPLGRQK